MSDQLDPTTVLPTTSCPQCGGEVITSTITVYGGEEVTQVANHPDTNAAPGSAAAVRCPGSGSPA